MTGEDIERGPSFSKSIIQDFVANLGYDLHLRIPDVATGSLEFHVRETICSWNLTQDHLEPLLRLAPVLCAFGDLAYRHLPLPIRTFVAAFTTIATYIDDISALPGFAGFQSSLPLNEQHEHPVLAQFCRYLCVETPKYYGSYGASCIIKAGLDFITGCKLEAMFPHGFPPARSKLFPRFIRKKTGISEAYAHALFPEELFPEKIWLAKYITAIPDMIDVIDLTNDVLSFYKESVVGDEENTFIQSYARTFSCTAVEALNRISEDVVQANSNSLEVLGSGGEELAKVYDDCIKGYVTWHFTQKRYRMAEIMG